MSDQLATLRALRAATTDPAQQAALDAAIAAMERAQALQQHAQSFSGDSQTGAAVAGNVAGSVVAPLFPPGASGNYVAGVLNVYQQAPGASAADYDAALRRYLDDLYARFSTLDLRGIDEQRPVEIQLTEIYISLTLRKLAPADLRGWGALRRFMNQMIERVRGDDRVDESTQQRTVAWNEILREHRRIAVVGKPGSGKTTLLHYTAVRLAEALARDDQARLDEFGFAQPLVPLFLPLRELGSYLRESRLRELSGNGPRLLLDCLANYAAGRNLDLPANFFSRLCETGRAILLLDGLDEVSRTDEREIVSRIVREFARRYKACRYVVTARVAAYTGAAEIGAGFTICTVDDLNKAQQQRFIANWSRCVHRLVYPRSSAEQVERMASAFDTALLRAIRENPGVGRLAPNPLLLTVIAIVFYNRQDLLENRVQLYEECVKVLLRGGRGKVDVAGRERATMIMGLEARRELLAAVAYEMHCGGEERKLIDRDVLEHLIATYLGRRAATNHEAGELARQFLNELPVHMGLLDEIEQNRFGFSHLSFQEFLAARHIAETDQWDPALDRYRETWWREVILLCAGHLSQERSWRFLGKLIERGATPDERAAALALAADALAELERYKGQGPIRGQVQTAAVAILTAQPAEAAPASARVRCGYALARVGDPRPGVCTLPPAMVEFPGGLFTIGKPEGKAEYSNEENDQPSTIAPFAIARYPVTNAQYALFIDDDGYNADAPWWDAAGREWLRQSGRTAPSHWNDERFGITRPNHPVVDVTWYEATAFCRWLTQYLSDGFEYCLPSEAEWEYAARGTTRRTYAWGDEEPDGERANCNGIYNGTTAVGCFPGGATPEGVYDMTGNVWEWTRSEYRLYPYNPHDGREDGQEPARKYFTLRGGSWNLQPILLRAADRLSVNPDFHVYAFGFRLARRKP